MTSRDIQYVIVDIDGTLNQHHGRFKSYAPEHDEENRTLLLSSQPVPRMIHLIKILAVLGYRIALATGRPRRFEPETIWWLKEHGLKWDVLAMRPDNDDRHDAEIKEDFLDSLLAQGYEVHMAFEDRQACVDMWRRRGLLCLQPAEGNF